MEARGLTPSPLERCWLVLRKLQPPFSVGDVEQVAGVEPQEAERYCGLLVQAGYLRRSDAGLIMIRDTGPIAPALHALELVEDGNDGSLTQAGGPPDLLDRVRASAESVIDPVCVFIDAHRRFRLSDVVRDTGLDRRRLLRVLDRLCAEGRLELVEDARQRNRGLAEYGPAKRDPVWRVVRGLPERGNRQRDCARDVVWRALRRLRRCTRQDLAEASGVNLRVVEDYLKLLKHHKLVESAGRIGRREVLILAHDPGPARPMTPEINNKGR